MTSRVIAKRLSDLPTYGLGYNTGALLYSEDGSNYQIPMTNFLTASKSFDVGFTITSIKEEIVYGGQRLVWTGAYPKTVPSGSTPDTTGGIGSGAWAYSNDSVLRENLRSSEGYKYIGEIPSIYNLSETNGLDGDRIKVTGYSLGSTLGGGYFYYDSAKKTINDGVLTFNGWVRLLPNNRVSIYDGGMVGDGVTDESDLFTNLVSVLSSQDNYYVITGNNQQIVKSKSVTIDLVKVGIENIRILDTSTNTSTIPYNILEIEGTQLSDRQDKGRKIVFDSVEISGAYGRGLLNSVLQNVNGVRFKPTSDLSGMTWNNCQIKYVNVGMVFSSNCYLMTFNGLTINSTHLPFATTQYTGESTTTLTNAGENILFVGGKISDSNMIGRLMGMECFLTFMGVSFDYTGGGSSVNYVQWSNFRQGTKLSFVDCHFESGNSTDSWTDNYFYVDTSVGIYITGGCMRHSATYNNCPYFFFDAGTYGQFSILNTDIWGTGIRTWSNRGMHTFYPMINIASSQVRGYLSERSELLLDPTFSKASGANTLDQWHVIGGTRTAAVVSSLLSCTTATITDATGTSYTTLAITKLATGSNCIVRLYVPCPKTHFSPHGSLSIYSPTTLTPSTPLSLNVGFLKTSNVIDAYGMPTQLYALTKVATDITQVTTTMTRIDARGALTQSDDHLGYNYIFMSLNLANLNVGAVVNITNINLEIPMKA